MIITRHLLSTFIDVSDIDMEKLCIELSAIGLEVERSAKIRLPDKVVVGKVVEKTPHANADKLSVCKVDVGNGEILQIVCGAKNVESNQFVAVALEGCVLTNSKNENLIIKKSTLRGIDSYGMLCSSTELGLPKTNDGIMVLDRSIGILEVGKELNKYPLFDDFLIEIGITPNRGDCLSVLGIAREIAGLYSKRLKSEILLDNVITLGLGRVLKIITDEKVNAHLLYRVLEIKQLRLPLEVALILAHNNTLGSDDVCNFLEYGTFMSGVILNAYKLRECESRDVAFDSELVAQLKIAKDENGLESVFSNDKLLSIIGISHSNKKSFGTKGEILIIEASYTNPNIAAQAGADKNIKSDASLIYRSARGSNPNLESGIDFLCKKMVDNAEVVLYSGTHSIMQSNEEISIKTTFQAINNIIGTNLDKEEIAHILKRLGFKLDATCDENFFMVVVPNYRHGISSIQDIAEEVLRIHGIDKVAPTPLYMAENNRLNNEFINYQFDRLLAKSLLANGFNECIHYVFTSSAKQEALGFSKLDSTLDLLNPITQELDTLRTSLIPSMLDSVIRNENLGYKNIALFEIGSAYNAKRIEQKKLAMCVSGYRFKECYPFAKPPKWDFFSFAGILDSAIKGIELKNISDVESSELLAQCDMQDSRLLHPYQSAFIYKNENLIGFIGKLNPTINADLKDVFVAEVRLDSLSQLELATMSAFSKYQKSWRDLTIMIDKNVPFYRIRKSLQDKEIPFITQILPLDIYTESSFGDLHALSIRLILQSFESTLNEEELNNSTNQVLEILKDEFSATLRV